MATQRMTVATIVGEAGTAVAALFQAWRDSPTPPEAASVDRFCEQLRANGSKLPVVYFCEWLDRWLMGDQVPGPDAVEGRRFQVACLSPVQAGAWADRLGHQHTEQEWFAGRLRESTQWGWVAEQFTVVVIREVLGPSTTDEEVKAALQGVPAWLSVSMIRA
jgi:hypothetical protein